MIRVLALIMGLQLAGEAVAEAFALPLPGPVLGMIALFLILVATGGPSAPMGGAARALLDNLGLLFVPAGVGVVLHLHLLGQAWPALFMAVVVSTLIAIAAVARVFVWLSGRGAAGGAEEG